MTANRKPKFKLKLIAPQHMFGSEERVWQLAGIDPWPGFSFLLFRLPLIAVIVCDGVLDPGPTRFLLEHALLGRSVTGDTARTHGECLVHWLNLLCSHEASAADATEIHFGAYRVFLTTTSNRDGRSRVKLSTATANLRTIVAIQYQRWANVSYVNKSKAVLHARAHWFWLTIKKLSEKSSALVTTL